MSAATTADRIRSRARAFDERFSRPADAGAETVENLLLIEAGAERFALRVSELAAFEPLRRIVPLAGARAEVLGIAGWRGRLVPVLGLAQRLGIAESLEPRWLAVHGSGADAVAFAFAGFHGQRQAPSRLIVPPRPELVRPHAPHLVVLDDAPIPVLSLPSLSSPSA